MPTKAPHSDALIRHIMENMHTSVLLFNQEGELSFINPAAEVLFEISARQVLGLKEKDLFPDSSVIAKALDRARETGQTFTEREIQLVLLMDHTATVDCTITLINDPPLQNAVLVELQQTDRQLRISREENLLAQHQAARAVVRGLAHEIKNPLGGLRGAAQLLERQLTDEILKEYTSIIIGEADRLQNLVDRMLGPNTLPHKKLVNIHLILEHVKTLVLAEVPGSVTLIRDYDPSIPEIYIDPEQIIQAVLNVVRNAVQAVGNEGTIVLRSRIDRHITIRHALHKLAVRIDVIDNGPGIADDMIEKIFYPMVTGRAEGTGLGLSISQSLVNQHGGLIECKSRPGETQFTLLLPLETSLK